MDFLPDWRCLPISDIAGNKFSATCRGKFGILEYDNSDTPVRFISMVSSVYTFCSPRDFFSDVARRAASFLGGDVCVVETRVLSSKIFVLFKLPHQFCLTADARDSFGLTLIACNTYSGKESGKVGAGAIRAFCTNGCFFGDHVSVNLTHKRTRCGTPQSDIVENVISRAVPIGQRYVDALVKVTAQRRSGVFTNAEKAKSLLLSSGQPLAAERVLSNMPCGLCFKVKVVQELYKQDGIGCTLYDIWNACTHVATHISKASSKYNLLPVINAWFDAGGGAWRECAG